MNQLSIPDVQQMINDWYLSSQEEAEMLRDEFAAFVDSIQRMLLEIDMAEDEEVRQIMDKYNLVL